MKEEIKKPTEAQMKALGEMGNIGANQAALALTQLIKKKIDVRITEIKTVTSDEMIALTGKPEALVAGIYLNILGKVPGKGLFLLSRKDALTLADILRERKPGTATIPTDADRSALKEATNIISGSYLSAISLFLKLLLLPSVPYITFDMAKNILSFMAADLGGKEAGFILVIGTELIQAQAKITGHFLLMPDVKSLPVMLKAIEDLGAAGQA